MSGMEITPSVMIDPSTGEEVISYDHAVIKDYSHIDDVQREHRHQEQNYAYYEDENGIHSRWADAVDTAEQQAEQQWNERQQYQEPEPRVTDKSATEDDDSEGFVDGDSVAQYIQDTQADEYREMMSWASDFCDDDFIQQYDQIMDEGNPDKMIRAINVLVDMYHKHGGN